MSEPHRLSGPRTIIDTGSCFRIETAAGLALAYVYYDEPRAIGTNLERLTFDEARQVAAGIAEIPEGPETKKPPARGAEG